MKISVIIPTYKREVVLCQTIESVIEGIKKSNYASESELIIVDQTKEHTTSTTLFLKNLEGEIKYIYEEKANLPNARNVGIKNSTGEILVFLDDDVILHEGFFNKVMNCYKHQGVKSVVGIPVLKNMKVTSKFARSAALPPSPRRRSRSIWLPEPCSPADTSSEGRSAPAVSASCTVPGIPSWRRS